MASAQPSKRTTFLDIVKTMDPQGRIQQPAEVISGVNELILDLHMKESNAPLGHVSNMRSSYPTVAYTKLNEGVLATKATSVQRQDTIGVLASTNEVDVRGKYVAGGDIQAYRRQQDKGFVEAMTQKKVYTWFYGDERVDALSFTGLAARYASLTGETGSYIVDGGGTGSDNTSMWVVDHGEEAVFAIYPKGTAGGLQAEDMGQQRVTDANGYPFQAWVSWFEWAMGLVLGDYRHCTRIGNIDVSLLADAGEAGYSGANLISCLISALDRMPPPGGNRRIIYANQTVLTALDLLATFKSNLALGYADWEGKRVLSFRGVPMHRIDEISSLEGRIT